nr:hypothetical protein [Tepidanaerobacter sp. EBM-49]
MTQQDARRDTKGLGFFIIISNREREKSEEAVGLSGTKILRYSGKVDNNCALYQ